MQTKGKIQVNLLLVALTTSGKVVVTRTALNREAAASTVGLLDSFFFASHVEVAVGGGKGRER